MDKSNKYYTKSLINDEVNKLPKKQYEYYHTLHDKESNPSQYQYQPHLHTYQALPIVDFGFYIYDMTPDKVEEMAENRYMPMMDDDELVEKYRVYLSEKLDGIFLSDWSNIVSSVSITPCGLTDEEKEYILDKYKEITQVFYRIYDVCTADVNNCYCAHRRNRRTSFFEYNGRCRCCGIRIGFNANKAIEGGLKVIKRILLSDEDIPVLKEQEKQRFLEFMCFMYELMSYCDIAEIIGFYLCDHVIKSPNKRINELMKFWVCDEYNRRRY